MSTVLEAALRSIDVISQSKVNQAIQVNVLQALLYKPGTNSRLIPRQPTNITVTSEMDPELKPTNFVLVAAADINISEPLPTLQLLQHQILLGNIVLRRLSALPSSPVAVPPF